MANDLAKGSGQSRGDLLTRAASNVMPKELAEEKLKSGKQLRVYFGIDPTGAKLHLGHAVPLRKLKEFADAGHHTIFLIGSFTAMVGDPTGQDAQRTALTKEEVMKNFETYKEQAAKIVDFKKIEIRYNNEWLDKLSFVEVMNLASKFTVQQMMQRDMFRKRMRWQVICTHCREMFDSPLQFSSEDEFEQTVVSDNKIKCPHCGKITPCNKENIIPPPNPISPNEFMYPIMQGYDSVVLDVDCEIGGNDQLFNMLCGRKLQKAFGKRDKFVLTTKLLEGTDGRKMSKTYDNCIYITDEANDMYGKVMSIHDDLMEIYFECCTDIPLIEAKKLLKGNPRDAKMRLAHEIVTLYHGEDAAIKAGKEFTSIFSDHGLPETVPEARVKKGSALLDVIVSQKLAPSNSEARRLMEQGGVSVNDKKIISSDAAAEEGILKVGKRKFLKISF